jgi:isopentenyl diphosphate isomerase/L-lactate dehydrogenase-like FMN-dependent dehydrogenase
MDDTLKQRIENCLTNDDASEATDILTAHAADIIDNATVAKLVQLVLDVDADYGTYFYPAVINRVEGDLQQRLHETLANDTDHSDFVQAMRDDRTVPHHGAIIDALNPERTDDDILGSILAEVGDQLSREHKLRIARALTVDSYPGTYEFVTAIGTLGATLDDETLLKVIERMKTN